MTAAAAAPGLAAPGVNDVLKNLSFFFGEPAVPEKLRDYSEHHAMTYHFPDAYYGQNTKIRDTLNNLILKSPQEWQTQVALPFVRIEGTQVEWDEMRFDVRLLQRVPYEGISRMQTSLRRRHRDRVVRRGIGMTIESNFYATEAGRQHFNDQLTSIRYCVQETVNFDCLFAYLTSSNYDFRYDLSKGLRPKRVVRQAMQHEVSMYAIVQKDDFGLDKAVEEVKYRMSRYQVTPNMMIVPPQLMLYLATAPEDKIKFIGGGERAVARFEDGVDGYVARNFRGLGVFQSMPFEVSEETGCVQMLERSVQVGEFYRMSPPPAWNKAKLLPANYMDIFIYDEERDQHKHITFRQALYASGAGADGFDIKDMIKFPNIVEVLKEAYGVKELTLEGLGNEQGNKMVEEVKRTMDATTGEMVLARAMKAIVAFAAADPLTVDIVAAVVEAGVWLPICITIARPFMEHLMLSAVVTVSGRDTGATLFGPADMQVSANTSVKTIEGHYTCHTKAVITKPQNVYVMRDIMCNGYVAGSNTRFFGLEHGKSSFNNPATPTRVTQTLNERLSRNDDAGGEYASMLAFLTPYSEVEENSRDQVISISNRVLPWEVAHSHSGDSKAYFPGGDKGFDTYKSWQLNQIHYGEDVRASESMSFITNGSVNNALCFIGPHRRYNPFTQNFYELVAGQGHFGPDAIPGDARWRRGEVVSQRSARNAMTSLEVAAQSQLHMRPSNSLA